MKQASFDVLGNIALVKFQKGVSSRTKKEFARKLLSKQRSVKTVLEKTGRFKGQKKLFTRKMVVFLGLMWIHVIFLLD